MEYSFSVVSINGAGNIVAVDEVNEICVFVEK